MVTHGLGLSIHLGTHGFAHAGLTRQGLVHGIDGNAKLGGYVLMVTRALMGILRYR